MSGVIVNACWVEARFIGSVNVIEMTGVTFVPAPRGEPVITPGRVTSTIVHVSFPVPAPWTSPAQSVPIERSSYVWPSRAPVYVPDVVVTGLVSQSVHTPPLSRTWIRYVATSSDSRRHWTRKLEDVCHGGSGWVEVFGGSVSTIVQVSFVAGGISTFPALSVAFERNW